MIIRQEDCPLQPWKNGLGSTREVAVHPSGNNSEDFLWRASVAEVDSAAPFSRFPGLDRHIVLLDGSGFTMTIDGHRTHALTTPFVPFSFDGEASVAVTLVGGATRNFNLMLRRTEVAGELLVWSTATGHVPDLATVLVYCARGLIETAEGALHAGDTWRPSSDAAATIILGENAVALAVRILPRII